MRKHGWLTKAGRVFRSTTAVVVLTLTALGAPLFVYAHNLQTKLVYMFFDPDTQAMLDARVVSNPPPAPLLQNGDEIGMIIKVVPRDGTTTGVGGHVDFYVPNGVQVIDVAYLLPGDSVADGITGYDKVPMKGQSLIALGAGPVGAKATAALGTLGGTYTNINGVTEAPVVAGTGLHRGTIAGVYGDTGIFYATDPDTSYGSWQRFTEGAGAGAEQICGLAGTLGLTAGKTITNNSGDVFIPCNKWDAGQMFAWGVKGTSCGLSGCQATPIVDSADGRGNTPWGFGSGTAGPESGYKWHFDWNEWAASAKDAAAMRAAMDPTSVGPWNRIKYSGSRVTVDQAGSASSVLGIAGIDASNLGLTVSPGSPLPATVSQTDGSSPKAIRWGVGQLTTLVPEYVWVKIRIVDVNALLNGAADGCPRFRGDTFGGDAGGSDLGKDHLWRYYEPSPVSVNACTMMGKPTDVAAVKPGQTFQYKVKMYNLGSGSLTNVVVKDTLPAGVSFISAFPAQNSGPNPLVWNVGTLLQGAKFESLVTVKATGTGAIDNTMCVTSDQFPVAACTTETTPSGNYPILKQNKTVTPTTASPGQAVTYTIRIDNIGSGASASPTRIEEHLDPALIYAGGVIATLNGASVTPTVTGLGTSTPVFTFTSGINAGSSLILSFNAQVSAGAGAGSYCNYFTSYAGTTPLTTGSLACVTVGAGGFKIGDTIYRDWNGSGKYWTGGHEEGLPGVTVTLLGTSGGASCNPACNTVTDANGQYLFSGLAAGQYTLSVPNPGSGGVPSGYTLTADPTGGTADESSGAPPAGYTASNSYNVTLGASDFLDADFGYKPGGAGAIGDKVFEDINRNGVWDTGEPGIPNVNVSMQNALGQNAWVVQTDSNGNYLFDNLPLGLNYGVLASPSVIDSYFGGAEGVAYTRTTANNPIDLPNLAGSVLTADFGFARISGATIGDQIYYDADASGTYNAGDTPLANVTVRLYASDGTTLLTTTSSGPSGTYSFSGLLADTYVVKVDTADTDIPTFLTTSIAGGQFTVPLSTDQTDNTRDFPFVSLNVLGKTVNAATANVSDTLTFTMTPSYGGPSLLTSATVTDVLPTGTTFGAFGQSGAVSNVPPLTWTLGSNTAAVNGSHTGSAGGGTVNAPAAADSWLDSANANTNRGSATTMRLSSGGGNQGNGRPVVRFDLSGIPAGATITAATLKLTVVLTSSTAARTVSVYGLDSAFVESQVTWNIGSSTNNWTNGGDFNTTALASTSVTGNAQYSWSSASLLTRVQGWYATPANNFGLLLGDTGGGTVTKDFATKEHATAGSRPVLEITYTGGGTPSTTTTLAVDNRLVTDPDPNSGTTGVNVVVTMTVGSDTALTGVAPPTLAVNKALSTAATATLTSGTPANVNISAGGTNTFTWTYRLDVDPAAASWKENLTFSGTPTHTSATFGAATSPSVILTQPLTFTANVASGATVINNTAKLDNDGVLLATSPITTTIIGGSIGDTVYLDANGNGAQDSGETGIPGVRVYVDSNGNGQFDGGEPNATTDFAGLYRIAGLVAGTYTARVDTTTYPPGYVPSTAAALSRTLTTGQQYSDVDFGFQPPPAPASTGSIGDTVWLDANNDGVKDASESGIPSVGVSLYRDLNGDGVLDPTDPLVGTTTTSASGGYGFTGLPIGSGAGSPVKYLVQVNTASTVTSPYDAAVTTTIAAGLAATTGTVNPKSVSLYTGAASVTNADFGYNWGGSIGNFAWYDTNADGLQNESNCSGAPCGAPNATLVLVYDTNGNGMAEVGEPPLSTYVTCDGTPAYPCTLPGQTSGSYLFANLPPGNYVVQTSEQEIPGPVSGNVNVMVPSTASRQAVGLTANQQVTHIDFGYTEAAKIEGHVFFDANNSGGFDGGETGLAGVTVTLSGTDSNGAAVNRTAPVTTANGEYNFLVPAGNYVITYNAAPVAGTYPTATTPTTISLSVISGVEYTGNDFGRGYAGSVGNRVWNDANNDGIQTAGESGIAGVTVALYASDGTTLLATTVTNASGNYGFGGLANATFVIKVPASNFASGGALNGFTATGEGDPGTPCGGGCDNSINAIVSGGANNAADFGYHGSTGFTVSGNVWNDNGAGGGTAGNGTKDGAEPGISGVTVTLYRDVNNDNAYDAGDTVFATGTTDGSGNYSFAGVPNAEYIVTIDTTTLPSNAFVQTGDPDSSCPAAGCNSQSAVTVSGANPAAENFGYQESLDGSIAGTVCSGTGTVPCADGYLSGVAVLLTYAGLDGILGTPDDVVSANTTAVNGTYGFPGLAPGLYQITKINPAGTAALVDADGGNPNNISVNLTAAQPVRNQQDFKVTGALGVIGDTVWLDANNDGVYQPNEAGLSGVTMYLCSSSPCTSGNKIAMTTTGPTGGYLFSGLGAGTYFVGVEPATVASGLTQVAYPGVNPSSAIALDAGAAYLDADFGYKPDANKVVLGDTVWYDANGNGRQEAGEVGIGGVDVTIIPPASVDLGNGAGIAVTRTTKSDGTWLAVLPGFPTAIDYVVLVDTATLPGGLVATPTNMGGGDTYIASLKAEDVRMSLDFGYKGGNPASIGDTVWLDANGNGARDAGEAGLSGVELRLYTTGADGIGGNADDQFVAYNSTDANGQYTFSVLLPGEYYVTIAGVPAGLAATTDSGATGAGVNAANGKTGEITVSAGQVYVAADFGYQPASGTAVMGDRVWSDANGNGVQDAGEAGIGGVTVQLRQAAVVVATTVTAADGSYLFTGVAPSLYDVVVTTPPVGYTQTGDPDVPGPCSPGCDHADTGVAVVAGNVSVTSDFGYQNATSASGSIGDKIYRSDLANAGVADVTVSLYRAGADNQIGTFDDVLVAGSTTDAGGIYGFSGLPAGLYRVVVTDVNVKLAGLTLTNTPAASVTITCPSCTTVTDQDFGYAAPTTTASGVIGNTVYFDGDGNGNQGAGEPGIPGVTVQLLDSTGTTVLATQSTDVNGNYSFTGLAAGSYRVRVATSTIAPGSVLYGLAPTQTQPGTFVITCSGSSCDTNDNADFGFTPTTAGTGTLSGTIWHDLNGNGTLQAGEPGLQGVTVKLWLDVDGNGSLDTGTDSTVATTTTNTNGDYYFLGLPAGKYIVEVTDTNGVTAGMTSVVGASPTADSNGHNNPYPVTLPPNTADATIDFAYKAVPAAAYSISGTVFEDAGSSLGTYNPPAGGDDALVPGATVKLYRVLGGVQYLIGTATTDGAGSYSFADLPAGGTYVVKVDTTGTFADGFQQTVEPNPPQTGGPCGVCDSQYTSAALTGSLADVNFGYWKGGVVTTPVTLAYFKATPGKTKGSVDFEWWTATETGNMGFELYVEAGKKLVRINPKPIPGKVTSMEPVRYTYTANAVDGDTFWIEDVGTEGGKRIQRGPYKLGKAFGHEPKAKVVDWKKVKKEKADKKSSRDRKLRADTSAAVELAAVTTVSANAVNLVVAREAPGADAVRTTYAVSGRVYRVTYEALVAAGVDLRKVHLNRLALHNRGQPVPINVVGGGSGKSRDLFVAGSYVEFVGEGEISLYTDETPYRLMVEKNTGARMAVDARTLPATYTAVPFYMERVTQERDKDYAIQAPNGDPWYDEYLMAWPGPSPVMQRSITVDQYLPGAAPVRLGVGVWGSSSLSGSPDHHVVVGFNGQSHVGDGLFDGVSDGAFEVTVPENLLRDGANTMSLQLPLDLNAGTDEWGDTWDLIALDSFSVTYPRRFVARNGRLSFTAAGAAFTVTGLTTDQVAVYRVDGGGTSRLSGVNVTGSGTSYSASFPGTTTAATYHVTSSNALGTPGIEPVAAPASCAQGGEARFLVISHEDFINADLQRLLDARVAEGYTVAVVPTDGLYAQYTHGIFDPAAIRACVKDAVAKRGTKAVLLVGSDTYDYLDNFKLGTVSHLPSFYAQTDSLVRWAPADGLIVDVDGDGLPDVAVGRFPVRTGADLTNMVDRTLQYRSKAYGQTAVFATDRLDTDYRHDFRADSAAIIAELPGAWTVQQANVDDLGLAGARSRLIGAINSGTALTAFVGHSGPSYWTFDGLFSATDATALTNAGRSTVVTQWGCWNTYYVSPFSDSLSHSFMLNGDRGAAAVLGASTLTEAGHETEFGKRLFGIGGLVNSGTTIGDAVLRTKRDIARDHPDWLDVIHGWQLLGDPLLKIAP